VTWTPYAMAPIASSSKGTYYTRTHLDKTADNDQGTYWITAGNEDEYVVFDFGERRSFDHLVLTVYRHDDNRNPRGYRFAISDDGSSWRTITAGENPDPGGASHYYELGGPVEARYLRVTLVDTFCAFGLACGEHFVLSDVKAGLLTHERQTSSQPSQLLVAPRATLRRRAVRFRVTCIGPERGTAVLTMTAVASDQTEVRLGRRRLPVRQACAGRPRVRVRRALLPALRRGRLSELRITAVPRSGQPSTTLFRVKR